MWIGEFLQTYDYHHADNFIMMEFLQYTSHIWLLAAIYMQHRQRAYVTMKERSVKERTSLLKEKEEEISEYSENFQDYVVRYIGKVEGRLPIKDDNYSKDSKFVESDLLFQLAVREERFKMAHGYPIVDCLTKAYEHFQLRSSSSRSLLYLAYLIGREYFELGEKELAAKFFEKILSIYIQDNWRYLSSNIWSMIQQTCQDMPNLRQLSLNAELTYLLGDRGVFDDYEKQCQFKEFFYLMNNHRDHLPSSSSALSRDEDVLQSNELETTESFIYSFKPGYALIDYYVLLSNHRKIMTTTAQVGDEAAIYLACYLNAPVPLRLKSICLMFRQNTTPIILELMHDLKEDDNSDKEYRLSLSPSKNIVLRYICHDPDRSNLTLLPNTWCFYELRFILQTAGIFQVMNIFLINRLRETCKCLFHFILSFFHSFSQIKRKNGGIKDKVPSNF
jgi:tetratricopeptide (TPR) repeat protein